MYVTGTHLESNESQSSNSPFECRVEVLPDETSVMPQSSVIPDMLAVPLSPERRTSSSSTAAVELPDSGDLSIAMKLSSVNCDDEIVEEESAVVAVPSRNVTMCNDFTLVIITSKSSFYLISQSIFWKLCME